MREHKVDNMDFMETTRKFSVAEIISSSFKLYSIGIRYYLSIFLVGSLANVIISWILGHNLLFFAPITNSNITQGSMLFLSNLMIIAAVSIMIGWMLDAVINGLAVYYSSSLIMKKQVNAWDGLGVIKNNLGSLLTVSLVSGLFVVLGMILLFIPGLIMATIFSLAVPVVILRRQKTFESLRGSRILVQKSWLKGFGVIAIPFLAAITSYVSSVGELLFGPILWGTMIVFSTLIKPLYPISVTMLYHSLNEDLPRFEGSIPKKTIGTILREPQSSYISIQNAPSRFCVYCGKQLPLDAIFCPSCGKKMET